MPSCSVIFLAFFVCSQDRHEFQPDEANMYQHFNCIIYRVKSNKKKCVNHNVDFKLY